MNRPKIEYFGYAEHPNGSLTGRGFYYYDQTWHGPFKLKEDAENDLAKRRLKLLSLFSSDEIKKELVSRQRPKQKNNPDWSQTRIDCREYINYIENGNLDGSVDDAKQGIFEGVMIALYGPTIFHWINRMMK